MLNNLRRCRRSANTSATTLAGPIRASMTALWPIAQQGRWPVPPMASDGFEWTRVRVLVR
jgi:hypothetical protein